MAALGLPIPKFTIVIPSALAEIILASLPSMGTLNFSAKISTYLLKLVNRIYSSKILQVTFCVTGQPIGYDFFFCFHKISLNLFRKTVRERLFNSQNTIKSKTRN